MAYSPCVSSPPRFSHIYCPLTVGGSTQTQTQSTRISTPPVTPRENIEFSLEETQKLQRMVDNGDFIILNDMYSSPEKHSDNAEIKKFIEAFSKAHINFYSEWFNTLNTIVRPAEFQEIVNKLSLKNF